MIPKIIHQLGPSDKSRWHPVWLRCYGSWQEQHSRDYTIKLWSDEEADDLVKTSYSKYFDIYKAFPFNICRIDFVRFCILHKFGGLYADLDYYCYSNFFNELTESCYVVGSTYNNEIVQNSLMAAEPNQEFFLECMEASKRAFLSKEFSYTPNNVFSQESNNYVMDITGPRLLSRLITTTKCKVFIMPSMVYNPPLTEYNESIKAKHMMTGSWSSDVIDQKMRDHKLSNEFATYQDYMQEDYLGFRKIDLKTFKFKPE